MKKKHPEHVNLERWLVSYADFITLLFAFFVIMYAISQADMARLKKVSSSLRKAFGATGPLGQVDLDGKGGGASFNMFEEEMAPPGGRIQELPAGKTNTAAENDPELQGIKEKLEESISMELGQSQQAEAFHLVFDSRGLVVRLAMKDFFEPRAIAVPIDLRPLLDRIGRIVTKTSHHVRIEGHTDASEHVGTNYPSGWELSSARAAWVLRYWQQRFEFDPRKISAAGMSSYHPLRVPNPRSKGKFAAVANRRVEIIITNQRYAK